MTRAFEAPWTRGSYWNGTSRTRQPLVYARITISGSTSKSRAATSSMASAALR